MIGQKLGPYNIIKKLAKAAWRLFFAPTNPALIVMWL
jgi:hypothetical protein